MRQLLNTGLRGFGVSNIEALRARFVEAYAAVPDKLRGEIIALVESRPFNWNTAFIEVNGKTKTGDTILSELHRIGILGD